MQPLTLAWLPNDTPEVCFLIPPVHPRGVLLNPKRSWAGMGQASGT